jgi:hypothetical protein
MRWGAVGSLGAIALVAASSARAGEDDGGSRGLFGAIHPEVAARMMIGTALTPSETAPGPMAGGGLGVRAGASYLGFYGGLSVMDFMSDSSCTNGFPGDCATTHAASYGLELGYGRTWFDLLTVRAQLGIGDYAVATDFTSTTCSGASCSMSTTTQSNASHDDLYLAPAVLLAFTLGPVLIGLDANLFCITRAGSPPAPTASFAAFMAGAQAGLRL